MEGLKSPPTNSKKAGRTSGKLKVRVKGRRRGPILTQNRGRLKLWRKEYSFSSAQGKEDEKTSDKLAEKRGRVHKSGEQPLE